MVALADREHRASAADLFCARLDSLLPVAAIPTKKFAYEKSWIPNANREKIRLDPKKTPYADGIMDAMDMPGVRVVAVKGSARWSKTIAAERKVLKNWTHGPIVNMLWLMQSKDDLSDYIDERVEWLLLNHDDVAEKIDWSDPKNGRFRKEIGGALALWRAATLRALRGKAAPLIIADEIDAYTKRVRNAIVTLLENRQREFGSNSLAYLCSHPDAGPTEGIDRIIAMGTKHMWYWICPHCEMPSSPAKGADHHMGWNLPGLMARRNEMETTTFLDFVEAETRLVCPHCAQYVDESIRMEMVNTGEWLQPHQAMLKGGAVEGDQKIARVMGFEGHGFMSPFVRIGELARGMATALITYEDTQDDVDLKEQTVKSLGETYEGAKDEEKIDAPKTLLARLQLPYREKTVPNGVVFLTAFVDVQGDRFEVLICGHDLLARTWIIDRFPIKQWPGFDTIDPAHKLTDWEIIEHAVINQRYVLARTADTDEPLYLPIAKTMVNAAGSAGVTNNARRWLSNAASAGRLQLWQVILFHGAASSKGEPLGKPKPVEYDDVGKALPVPIRERAINVHEFKKVIAKRYQIEDEAAAGRIGLPFGFKMRYVDEMTAERYLNGEWVQVRARNETFDGLVACEAGRQLTFADRPELWIHPVTKERIRPDWATPVPRDTPIVTPAAIDAEARKSYYERLAELNRDD